jgi:hypothetical protein
MTKSELAVMEVRELIERVQNLLENDEPRSKFFVENMVTIRLCAEEMGGVLRELARPNPQISEQEVQAVARAALRISHDLRCKIQTETDAANPKLM